MRTMMFLLLLPLGLCEPGASATGGPKKTPHRIVRVSDPDARRPAEVSVAINPNNADHVIAVSTQGPRGNQPGSNYAYASFDGGRTWTSVVTANPEKRIQGDDVVVFGPDGTAHHAYIAFAGIRAAKPLRAVNGIHLQSSIDGLKWGKPVAIIDHINTVEPFEDKPWVGVDLSSDSPHRGNIYVAWTRFDVYGSKDPAHKSWIYLARSRNGGKSFDPTLRISDKPGNALDDSDTVEGAVPAVGPKGEVYIAWAGPEGIVFDKSTDGGWSFGMDRNIAQIVGGWSSSVTGLKRHNGMPVTATDVSKGKHRGSVYVSWIDKRFGDTDVFLIASRDGGQTWTEPKRVNDDPQGNGKEQMFAWMCVDPQDGAINILFYDRRDLQGAHTGLTLARSVDGGQTFINHRIDQEPFETNNEVFFGDYMGVAASGGRVIGVYMHFTGRRSLALSAALFRFRPGTNETIND